MVQVEEMEEVVQVKIKIQMEITQEDWVLKMSGYFSLESGEKLFLLVGQQGLSYFNYNGGGGGGTFVAKGSQLMNATPLIVAGGGGSSGIQYNQDATTSESGLDAKTNNGPNSTGGSNGQGVRGHISRLGWWRWILWEWTWFCLQSIIPWLFF